MGNIGVTDFRRTKFRSYYVHVTSRKLVARGDQYGNLWVIYNRLMMLLARMDGPIPANYEVDIPEGW